MPLRPSARRSLQTPVAVERFTGEDTWGNDTFAAPEAHGCLIESQTEDFGAEDGLGQQEARIVRRASIMTDALGLKPKDRITVAGITLHITSVETTNGKDGVPVFQSSTAESTSRG